VTIGCSRRAFPARIEAHAYAVFVHRGRLGGLPAMIEKIYGEWLPEVGYAVSGEFYFEFYDDRFQPDSVDSVLFVWVPVREEVV